MKISFFIQTFKISLNELNITPNIICHLLNEEQCEHVQELYNSCLNGCEDYNQYAEYFLTYYNLFWMY